MGSSCRPEVLFGIQSVMDRENRVRRLVVLTTGNELPLVHSAIPMGKRIGFWDKQ